MSFTTVGSEGGEKNQFTLCRLPISTVSAVLMQHIYIYFAINIYMP